MIEEKYIAAADLGTSRISLGVAKIKGDDIQVVYYRETPSDGISKSVVENPMKASIPLKKAIEDAEHELLIKISQMAVGLPRYSVIQEVAEGGMDRNDPEEYITREEVENLKSIAVETYPIDDTKNQIMFGAVAQSFSTDDQMNFREEDVIGTISDTLKGNFKVFIGRRKATTAVDKIFNGLGIAPAKQYFLPEMTAKAVLSEEEMENGVALVDLGAGVTSVTIYQGGIMRHYEAIPFGGWNITNDIKMECSISEHLAENIKLAYGACMPNKLANLSEKIIQIRNDYSPNKEVPVKYISEIIDARIREILDAVLFSIQESGLQKELRSGMVLTGGGAKLANIKMLAKEMSGYTVRIGIPRQNRITASGCPGVFEPSAASLAGMLMAAKDDNLPDCAQEVEKSAPAEEDAPDEPMTMDEVNNGQTGTLIQEEEFGPAVPKEKKQAKKREKKAMSWIKFTNVMDHLYNTITDDKL